MSNQRTVTCYLSKEDYQVFLAVCNKSHVSRNAVFAGELLRRGIEARLNELTVEDIAMLPMRSQLALIEMKTRQKEWNQETLNAIVARGVDEETADMLDGIISELDLDETAAVGFAQDSPFPAAVAYMNNGTQSGRCQRWLAQYFTENETVPRLLVTALAERKGFSENMVNRASRRLKIVKKKGSGGAWHWSTPINNNNNNTEQT